jgi:hypothetical protein
MTLLRESKPLPEMKNSPEAVQRFPFPFSTDSYGYSVNLVPAGQGKPGAYDEHLFDIDEHYHTEIKERERILAEDYGRRCLTLPHMMDAQWDFLEMGLTHLAAGYPEHFTLSQDSDCWHWENRLLGLRQDFIFGDPSTLPLEPLEWTGRQMQGDFCLLDQRESDLYLDAGLVTFPADWSLAFDLGMTFEEWHGPVPLAHPAGVFTRAKKFLMGLQTGQPWQRLNWTFTVGPRLDTAPETYHLWGRDKPAVTAKNAGETVHLRVEVQVLARLPRSHGVLFSIRTYLIRLDEMVMNPDWAKRLRRVLGSLPAEITEYKGLTHIGPAVIAWLTPYDDQLS